MKRSGNTYDFYEVPQGGQTKSQGEQGRSSHDFTSSQDEQDCSSIDIEIDNTYKDNTNISEKDSVVATPQAGGSPCTPEQKQEEKGNSEFTFGEWRF